MRMSDWSSDVCSSDLSDKRQYQQPGMRVPGQIERVTVKHQADQFRTQGREQATDRSQQPELDAPGLDQQGSFGTQCAEQRTLVDPFIKGGLQAGEQHGHPRGQYKPQDRQSTRLNSSH